MQRFVIGLDLGTTSVKAVMFYRDGKVKAEAEQLIKTVYSTDGYAEQDPEVIVSSAVFALKSVLDKANVSAEDILGIGFSSAMHSLICTDGNGRALSKAMIWADGRGRQQAKDLMESEGAAFYKRTGTPIHPMSPLTKLMWMKETGYGPYLQAEYMMSIKEYIIFQWFQERAIDYAMASATGMLDGRTLRWDREILETAGIREEQLGTPVSPDYQLGELNPVIAGYLKLPAHIPFVIGSADGQLANLGSSGLEENCLTISAGTSGAVRKWTNSFTVSEGQEVFCYAFTPDHYITGGPTNNGGVAIDWLKKTFNYPGTYEELINEAAAAPTGADGLIFLPYINGERAPLWDQDARGSLIGLSISHGVPHYARAVLEGITLNLYQIYLSLGAAGEEAEVIYVNGGLSRSALWVQILSNIFNKPVQCTESHHSAAWGAAWLVLTALGEKESLDQIKENIPLGERFEPDEDQHEEYRKIYERYSRLVEVMTV
ncbi:gluconokinase [Jeotgalibacillus haloalkalitolerans]|uniref:Gluconokinase n=1 Tax=Jeotgalibacillus haloalkalitolerans TaxID=3104292 RepID=A0ABU5KHX0_9BACL|nr:gluconokinase [Jeotgalibacillus sp. HH7-29]MDZ5710827.1 gluconokinase [Jeotgalibacillus sp. HH7-29]